MRLSEEQIRLLEQVAWTARRLKAKQHGITTGPADVACLDPQFRAEHRAAVIAVAEAMVDMPHTFSPKEVEA